ncbi:MAG: alpha/beta hydrolase [Bacteroidales bacterium]|nr:alpha/beta hydrolase [Bacteroidales bacterium]
MKRIAIALILAFTAVVSAPEAGARISRELRSADHLKLAPGVTLTPFVPENPSGTAIVVCPGGSYHWLDEPTEGLAVAKWLADNGITAFVLRYAPGTSYHNKMYAALESAISYVRANAADYGVNPSRIGAMGFSAGGHLVMRAAEFAEGESRPDFVAPIYPVVTMLEPYVHGRSRRGLLSPSERRDRARLEAHSLELNVPADCPPVFLMNCVDDPIVDYQNSELLYAALSAAHVSVEYIQYPEGGHGFGAERQKQNKYTSEWQSSFISWLKGIL